jgi:exopolysaccharide biosynthesis polyprenyl glycosylphosphotransferase
VNDVSLGETQLELGGPAAGAGSAPAAPARSAAALSALQNKQRQRMLVRSLTFAADLLAIAAAFIAANFIRFDDPLHSQGLNMAAALLLIYLPIALNGHAYSIANLVKARIGATKAMMCLIIAIGAIGLVVFFLKVSTDFSRAVFGTGAALSVLAVPIARLVLAGFARNLFAVSALNEVVIEDGFTAGYPEGALLLDAAQLGLAPRLDDHEMLERISRYLRNADRVIVACLPERRRAWAFAMKGADVHAEVFAPEVEALGPLAISHFGSSTTLVVATGPLAFADQVLKRAFDLGLTLLALPVVLPFMALIAIAIRLESRGPVIFVQKRVGFGNRLFHTYKFRSMYPDRLDLSGTRSTGRHDERVTRVGRFIRAHSLDELPQLFNVLRGEMSIVGPRPHALGSRAEDKLFWDIDANYWHRHAVKPGLTGLAQVRGYRGATETVSDLSNRLQADLEYLSGWSLWRDITIIFATFRVLVHRNAY